MMNLRFSLAVICLFWVSIVDAVTVLGRCHMDTCWWMDISQQHVIATQEDARLIRFEKKTVFADFKNGQYPKQFPKTLNRSWGPPEINYILCSRKLPMYIESDQQGFIAYIPFDNQGQPSGATEGVTNLYNYVCYGINDGQEPPIQSYSFQGLEQCQQIKLKAPKDVFKYIKPCA